MSRGSFERQNGAAGRLNIPWGLLFSLFFPGALGLYGLMSLVSVDVARSSLGLGGAVCFQSVTACIEIWGTA